jgi:cellulase (glycosyl hydrolase family 5)
MNARTKHLVVALAVMPVVATVAVGSTATSSSAVANRQQTMSNGNFDKGRVGWATSSAGTRLSIVKKGRGNTRAALLTQRRTGPAILNSRSNVVRSAKAGQRYTVSAWVRTSQAGASGRMVLRETSNGRAVKNSVKRFRAWKAWRKVTMSATTRRAGTELNVRLLLNRLAKKKFLVVDDVSVLKWLPPKSAPAPTYPTPLPDPGPGPGPITPPGPTVDHLSNGCGIDARGIPGSCAAYLGSAYGSNTDPTPWENTMGQQLGVRRTYWGASQVDKAVSVAKTDLAANRVPWISFKLPYSWPDMASGKGDAWARDLATKLSKLNGPVWLAFHHEPEGDAVITDWTRMQARLAPLVRAIAPNVAYSIVLTGWNQFYGPSQYSLDSLWPKNTKIDLLGVDTYEKLGVVKDGKEQTKSTDWQNDYFGRFSSWANAHGVAWGVAETGYSDRASELDPQWVSRTYNLLKANGGVAFTYFNTTLNSASTWALTPAAKKQQFAAAMRGKPTL